MSRLRCGDAAQMWVLMVCAGGRLSQKGMARMLTRQSPVNRRRASLKAPALPLSLKPDTDPPTEASSRTMLCPVARFILFLGKLKHTLAAVVLLCSIIRGWRRGVVVSGVRHERS